MYRVVFHKTVRKFFDRHPVVRKQFFGILPLLKKNPWSRSLNVKKMYGTDNHYRLRIGKWRFLFFVQKEQVLVYFYDAGSR